jgi:uncharacterized protein YrzB (UPF0473 family)
MYSQSKSTTVGILKQRIQENQFQTLADIQANRLKLYHVAIPTENPQNEDDMIDYAAKVQEEMDKQPPPTELKNQFRELVEIFKGIPPRRTLHIIVRHLSG